MINKSTKAVGEKKTTTTLVKVSQLPEGVQAKPIEALSASGNIIVLKPEQKKETMTMVTSVIGGLVKVSRPPEGVQAKPIVLIPEEPKQVQAFPPDFSLFSELSKLQPVPPKPHSELKISDWVPKIPRQPRFKCVAIGCSNNDGKECKEKNAKLHRESKA